MKSKWIVMIALAILLTASMFGITAFAIKPVKPNPLDEIWNAITTLQNRVVSIETDLFGLQTLIGTRSPRTGRISFSPADFGVVGDYIESQSLFTGAPVHLPDGVKITHVGFTIADTSIGVVHVRLIHLKPDILNELPPSPNAFLRTPVADLFSENTPIGADYHVQSVAPITSESIVDNTIGPCYFTLEIDRGGIFYNCFIEFEYVA